MTRVRSEDIKTAVIQRLVELFPSNAVYKESITNPSFPHFFVYQVDLTDTQDRREFHFLDYSMDVTYRVASDPSTNLKLQTSLDSVQLQLAEGFNVIPCGDSFIRITDKSFQKVDGVLHFFFHVVTIVKNEIQTETAKQNSLEVNINIREK